MITDTLDLTTPAIISPENFYGAREALCDTCIVTFSNQIISEILHQFECTTIAEIETANGS